MLAVLLTDSLWRRKFSADPGIVGKSIELDGQAYTVVGILPANFRFPDKTLAPECLYPAQFPRTVDWTSKKSTSGRPLSRPAHPCQSRPAAGPRLRAPHHELRHRAPDTQASGGVRRRRKQTRSRHIGGRQLLVTRLGFRVAQGHRPTDMDQVRPRCRAPRVCQAG